MVTTPAAPHHPTRVVVAGGSRGIGLAVALRFAGDGAQVLVVARHRVPVPPGMHLVVADLVAGDGPLQVRDQVCDVLGGVDVLVDNVGNGTRRSEDPLVATDEDWGVNLSTNLMAVVRLDRALVPLMVRQRSGVVIHVSSIVSRMVQVDNVPYAAAKAALNAYSKGLASSVGQHGVRVCVVSPGAIATDAHGFADLARRTGRTESDVRADFERSLGAPLGRMGEVAEVAETIAFLASPRSSYLTGVQLAVDGGLMPTTA